MIRFYKLEHIRPGKLPRLINKVANRLLSTKTRDPLRILFCGSDDFSVASLRALHRLQQTELELIKSIDVVCRPIKRTGRGLKQLREVPASIVARELGLPLHHVDTFRGWDVPSYETNVASSSNIGAINLVVAVSFGLLIPPRILGEAKYGGLNIHPSLLPEFRGAAPIEHTLLARRRSTGVTLQTLHPRKWDHGKVLLQWPNGGFEIPQPDCIQPAGLKELLAPLGADMLVHGIRSGLYVPSTQDLPPEMTPSEENSPIKAPKITPEDRHVRWGEWTADDILLHHRVIGPLWSNIIVDGEVIRITFSTGFVLREERALSSAIPVGVPMLWLNGSEPSPSLYCKTVDGSILSIDRLKIPGYGEMEGITWARKANILSPEHSQQVQLGTGGRLTMASSKFN